MCGIIGYTGKGNAVQKVIDGLASLEYRGYDSVGVGVRENGKTVIYKTVGRVKTLDEMIKKEGGITSSCVIGHTRWATHGAPSYENAHPHKVGAVTAVHNGIIENYAKIEEFLSPSERVFASQTDTEVAVALINHFFAAGLSPLEAIRAALSEIRGSYALGIIFDGVDDKIYIAKKDSPLIIGIAEDGTFLASDVTAILKYTKKYVAMSDGDVAELTPGGYKIFDASGAPVSREICEAEWDVEAAEKCGYEHFMLKEISEEPEALTRTLSPRIKDGKICFDYDKISDGYLKDVKRLFIVACGTARHAGLMAKYYFERLCRIPVSVEVASEFRYSEPIINKGDTVMIISQSGETADSLAALRLAKELGAHTVAVVNVFASSIAREADKVLYTYAGPEIAVASTKAYTVQTALLASLSVRTAYAKGLISETELEKYTKSVYSSLPDAIEQVFSRRGEIEEIAKKHFKAENAFFIGRGADSYVTDEASLKLKEISYIHSESYPAGELKHGTISLVSDGVPVIAVATRPSLYEKITSNIREVSSRGGDVILICGADFDLAQNVSEAFVLPECDEFVSPIAAVTATQLFAYETAKYRGCDIDKPRNLAKSVTVE